MRTDRPTSTWCCRTSPSSMCFWAVVFLVAYGAGMALRPTFPVLDHYGNTLLLAALGLACVLNAVRNRTYHCVLTGPLFLAAALVDALTDAGIWHVESGLVWSTVVVGVCAAFVAEWRATQTTG